MKYRLFAGQGRWLVTPEFLLPPASTACFDPLIAVGLIDEGEFDAGELHYIETSIGADFYAKVPDSVVARLRPALASRLGKTLKATPGE